jgi:hypothetical protein
VTWFALIFSIGVLVYSLKAHRDAKRAYERAAEVQAEALRRFEELSVANISPNARTSEDEPGLSEKSSDPRIVQ